MPAAPPPQQDQPTDDTQNTKPLESGEGTATESPADIPVATPYKTFYCPGEWEGQVQILKSDDGENYTSTFQMEIKGKTVKLFAIVLGPDESEGYLLGKLQDESAGEINVYCVINVVPREGWSEEAYRQINAYQERVNDIIMQFYEDARFEPNKPN